MRLTDLQIRKLKAPEKGQKTYFDDALPGFGVRVSQGGTKSFVVMYGLQRRLRTIGRYPAIGLSEARLEAKRLQAELTDPATLDPQRQPRIAFDLARTRFISDCDVRNKASTAGEYRRLLHRHFRFTKDLGEITRADIAAALDVLAATPSEQKHAFVPLRTMLNWCVKRGFIDRSPLPPLSFKTEARSNVLSDRDLAAVWNRALEIGYPYGSIVQLLILTGQRRGEIAALRRSWIEDDLAVFPTGFTKNRREHRLPLSPISQRVISDLPEVGDLLFPARGSEGRPFSGWGKSKERFDRPLQVAPYTLHDLRRTFSSNLARLGTPIHVTEKLLNHVSGTVSGVAAVYDRYSYVDEMRVAISEHDRFLCRLAESTGD